MSAKDFDGISINTAVLRGVKFNHPARGDSSGGGGGGRRHEDVANNGGRLEIPDPNKSFIHIERFGKVCRWLGLIGGGEIAADEAIKLDEEFAELQGDISLSDKERVYALMLRIELIRKYPGMLVSRDPDDPEDEYKLARFFVKQTGRTLDDNERLARLELGDLVIILRDRGSSKVSNTPWGHRYHEYAFGVAETLIPHSELLDSFQDSTRLVKIYKTGIEGFVYEEIWAKGFRGEDELRDTSFRVWEDYDGSL